MFQWQKKPMMVHVWRRQVTEVMLVNLLMLPLGCQYLGEGGGGVWGVHVVNTGSMHKVYTPPPPPSYPPQPSPWEMPLPSGGILDINVIHSHNHLCCSFADP